MNEPSDQEPSSAAEYVPVEPTGSARSHWFAWPIALAVIAFLAIFAIADLDELWRVFAQTDLRGLAVPVLCVVLSYVTMALSYHGITRAAGWSVSFVDMLKITLVANSLNYLLATGGLSGFAARLYYFTSRNIPSGTAVVISLVQTFMTNMSLLFFILVGFGYVVVDGTLGGASLGIATTILAVFVVAAIAATILLFHRRLRRRTLFTLAQSAHWLIHRLLPHRAPPRTHIWRFQFNLNRGIDFLLERRRQMIVPLLYITIDWVFTILILHTSFAAVGHPVFFRQTVVGFAIGIILSYVSLIPGGLGIMEGSMAAVFTGMGVPFEIAVAAVFLFRAIYYVLPLVASVVFLRSMLRRARDSVEAPPGR